MSRARSRGARLNGKLLYPEDGMNVVDWVMTVVLLVGIGLAVYGGYKLLGN